MAKWILRDNYPIYYKEYFCDNCEKRAHHIETNGRLETGMVWTTDRVPLLTPYCPYCGEKMENPTFHN